MIQFDEHIFQLGVETTDQIIYVQCAQYHIYIYIAHLWEMQVKTAIHGKKHALNSHVLSDVSVFPVYSL